MSEEKREKAMDTNAAMPQYGNMAIGDIITVDKDKNKKGDLFNRLVFDVFHVLGFEDPQQNIQKTGREIDMFVRHRTEHRVAIIESKAQAAKIGGDDLNKFVGAVDAEHRRLRKKGVAVVGYFVSKSGFTATALDQERDRTEDRREGDSEIILLGPEQLIKELINGNILCSTERAVSAVRVPEGLSLCGKADLLASEFGWIWVLYYSSRQKQAATHFAFVHADGNRLLGSVAKKILDAGDERFSGLKYIPAEPDAEQAEKDKNEAKEAYFSYLDRELGEIQFEGMPTDKDAGSVKVKLENVFVPLRYIPADQNDRKEELETVSIRDVLTASTRAAILARPGGGKSTLIRRIALACAFPERRKKVDDGLPETDLFPVYLRCRDMNSLGTDSITDIIYRIIYRAEKPQYAEPFKALIEDELQDGRMLLLIDGLDEISNERERICFVDQLRVFVATYPSVHLVVTSRETGFRAVARVIENYCAEYSIADLDEEQIRRLSLNWHEAILNDKARAREDSEKVCDIILGDERIRALAINPLLLTTLLFVKRWVGYLPTKRCTLYGEMIKLLLVTWNAVGHERLDLDETEPQLAFVAHYMTTNGKQTITRDELEKCIIKARRELQDTLGYTKVSPSQFIDQVEERSSLLIQRGLEENARGELVPSYEFSHLSFQEYLTARALTEAWLPSDAEQDVVSVLQNHMQETQWLEVIPLAAVLSGRKDAKEIVSYLLHETEKEDAKKDHGRYSYRISEGKIEGNCAVLHLANCIANELSISEIDLEKALQLCVKSRDYILDASRNSKMVKTDIFETILNSKYGAKYKETVEEMLFKDVLCEQFPDASSAWLDIDRIENGDRTQEQIAELLKSDSRADKIKGALLGMRFSFRRRYNISSEKRANHSLPEIFSSISSMLRSNDAVCVYSAAWCIAWAGYNYKNIIPVVLGSEMTKHLVNLWVKTDNPPNMKRILSWALASLICDTVKIKETLELKETVKRNLNSHEDEFTPIAALFVGILIGMLKDEDAKRIIQDLKKEYPHKIIWNEGRFLRDRGYGDILDSKDARS